MIENEKMIENEVEENEVEENEEIEDEEGEGEERGKGRRKKEEVRNYVQINDNFRFSSDNYCFILERLNPEHEITRGKYKGGISETKWEEVGYFGELKQLVKYCIEYYIRDACGDLKEIYKRLEEMKNVVDEIVPIIRVKNGVCVIRDK